MKKLVFAAAAWVMALLLAGLLGGTPVAWAAQGQGLPRLTFESVQGQTGSDARSLEAVGGSFPGPLYSQWFKAYAGNTGVSVTYHPDGSGFGIEAVTKNTADFGASDAALSDAQLAGSNADVVHVPTAFGGIVLVYNLPGVKELKLTGENIADIFLGNITRWDDQRLVANNSQLSEVNEPISVVTREEVSGTTFGFTSYLAAVSQTWQSDPALGAKTRPAWRRGVTAAGNDGVANTVKDNPGSIGYVELNFALAANLTFAKVKNKAGVFVEPTLEHVNAAANSVAVKGLDLRINAMNAPGRDAYPIVTATYVLVHRQMDNRAKALSIAHLLWWMTHEAQSLNEPMYYARVPESLVTKTEQVLRQLSAGGKPVLSAQ